MGIRKKIVDGVSDNVLTDEELKDLVKQVELKKELHLQHDKLINSEILHKNVNKFTATD